MRPSQAYAVGICRAALAKDVLRKNKSQGGHWKFGRRIFNNRTVMELIANGEAVRVGDVVSAVKRGGSNG